MADDVAAVIDGDVDFRAGIHGSAFPDTVLVLLQPRYVRITVGFEAALGLPLGETVRPGSGAFASTGELGVGAVVDVWATAPKEIAEAIIVTKSSFFILLSRYLHNILWIMR